jgi:hypothetical protein
MDTSTSKELAHYIGIAAVICACAILISSLPALIDAVSRMP